MKYLKRFNESGDEYQTTWAGSSWAFNNPEIPIDPKTEPIPQKQAYPHRCLECGAEYYFIREDGEPTCPTCKSKESEDILVDGY